MDCVYDFSLLFALLLKNRGPDVGLNKSPVLRPTLAPQMINTNAANHGPPGTRAKDARHTCVSLCVCAVSQSG